MSPDEAWREELLQAAQRLGLNLENEQIRQLLGHLELLTRWNKAYNLTAIREPAEMFRQHLLDSMAVVPALLRLAHPGSPRIVDVGSGAGFPGLTIAAAMPASKVVCVDSVGKKVGFIRQVVAELGVANASATHARIENVTALEADVITSRAFASLKDFTAITRKHLAPDGVWMAMKGKTPDVEIAELSPDIEVFHVEQLHVPGLARERCLVWMRPIQPPSAPNN